MRKVLYYTKSVCPVCLRPLSAAITAGADGVYMEKCCPDHGGFSVLIWADTEAGYVRWLDCGGVRVDKLPQTPAEAQRMGGDFSCPACSRPASAALMTTNRCNTDCPVCFTRDKKEPLYEPDLETCLSLARSYREREGEDAILELCGGEPTVREDICALAAGARDLGFDFIQLNTNGIKLAESPELCHRLRESGVTTVYLGFDGVTEKPYLAKYGRPMLQTKLDALHNCAAAGLAVILVTCVIPGENDGELGAIVELARENMPAVRGVYLQPISYFGIYPEDDIRRITIPDLIRRLEAQHGDLNSQDFMPGAYEHPQCSFQACYMLDAKGRLRPLTRMAPRAAAEVGACQRVRQSIRRTWLPGDARLLTIGGMAFQDAWNVDLMRLRRCSIQILGRDGGQTPLCGKYLTGCGGSRILPGIS